jgi:hypothetical protein
MLNATFGGTGIAAYVAGDLLRANSTTTLQRLAIGTNGQVLTVVAGAPAWAAASTGSVTSVSGTGTVNGLTLTGTVTSSGNLTLGGVLDLSSPPAIGGTAAAAGTFTTLRVDSTISLAGSTGTAGYVLTSQGASAPTWTAVSSGSGNVVGPASATANGIALFDGTTGLLLKNSASTDALIRGMTLGLGSGTGNFASTALGVNALLSNTTGSYNVAFGYDALSSNTTGEYHAAFGYQALDSQTTGTENTAVGYWALQSTNTGSYNTAMGGFAGSDLTTGSNNLFLGVDSGNNLTTGSNNVYIGKATAFSPSESNNIVFGDGSGERWRITDTGAWYINANTGTSGQVFTSNGSATNPTWTSLGTMSTQNSTGVFITGGSISDTDITVKDDVFTLQDNLDPTKQAQFQLSGLLTGTTYVYTLPTSGSGASTLVDLNSSQTISATKTLSSATQNLGSSANTGTQQFAYGSTASGNTKTVNVGTGGLSGSTTNIAIGSSVSGATSTTTMNGVTNFLDTGFTLQDNADTTKQAQFQLGSITTATTRAYTLPNLDTVLAGLAVSQTFSNTNVFSNGTNTFGSATGTGTNGFSSGATTTGNTKTVNVGTGGLSGSTTNITVGSANGSTTTLLGTTVIGGAAGSQSLQVNSVASAVNYAQIVGAVTNSNPLISALGTDTDIGLNFDVKGVGTHKFRGVNGSATQFSIDTTTNAVNFLTVTGGVAGGYPPIFRNTGSDANIGMVFVTKGTGNILLTTNYATQAQVSATASAVNYLQLTGAATGAAPTISAQGSDANIGLTYTSKGTGVQQFFVGAYPVLRLEGGLVSQQNTLQLYAASNSLNLNAIGADTTINFNIVAKGSAFYNFQSGNGIQFLINSTASAVNYAQVTGAATGAAPTISAAGSDANIGLVLTSKGTGVVALGGNTVANSGFVVLPTTSSVNYVQVNGGTAGGAPPVLAATGTDANIGLGIRPKGSFSVTFNNTVGSTIAEMAVSTTGFGVNFVRLTGAATANAPELSAQGSDTNINLKLTTKGTGTVQYGTYTAGVLSPTGYITITDAGGTSRRLLVG